MALIKIHKISIYHAIGNFIGSCAGLLDSIIGITTFGFMHGSFQFKWGLFRLGTGIFYSQKR